MRAKLFTLEEANFLVPQLSRKFEKIFRINSRLSCVMSDINDLLSIWGNDILDSDNPDNHAYAEKLAEKNNLSSLISSLITDIQSSGCIIKDIKSGLVDFYHQKEDGEVVFLCWKFGEPAIEYYHQIDEGFGSRRSVNELQKEII